MGVDGVWTISPFTCAQSQVKLSEKDKSVISVVHAVFINLRKTLHTEISRFLHMHTFMDEYEFTPSLIHVAPAMVLPHQQWP